MSDDITTRLRDYRSHRIYMRYPDRDGNLPERVDWNLTGTEPNTLMVEAAAEIERLRFQLKVMTEEHRAACEDRDAMMRERDEAKQRA